MPGTYAQVEPNPQGLGAVLMAPIAGLYDPATGMANAIDVAVFVLVIGGFLAVVTKTGAIDAGIGWLLTALRGREIWMIPILMTAFALGGTSYGMAEESLAFYAIVLPVFIRAGYDAVTGVAVIMLGAGIGTLGSTFNAFATVVGSNAAGVPFTDGLLLRVVILVVCLAAGILFVMRYATQVKADPARSIVADQREDNVAHFLKGTGDEAALPEFTRTRSIILALFGLTFAVMLYGVIALGWWMGQMSALFLGMAILTFFVAQVRRRDEDGRAHLRRHLRERRARPARGRADHRRRARHRRGHGRRQDHRHDPARPRGGARRARRRRLHQPDAAQPDAPVLPRAVVLRPGRPVDADPRAAGGLRRRRPQPGGHRLSVGERLGEPVQPDLRGGDGRAGDRAGVLQPLAALRLAAAPDPGDHHRGRAERRR